MGEHLDSLSREDLLAEIRKLRSAIREHRNSVRLSKYEHVTKRKTMKNLTLALCLAIVFQGCAGGNYPNCSRTVAAVPLTLVSDVDDTVKVTNVPHFFAKVKNGLTGKLVFAGMPELYNELRGKDGPLEFVSGAPAFLRKKVTKRLDNADFSPYQLMLKERPAEVGRFKLECLKSMYSGPDDAGAGFILIGDDTEKDPEVYKGFRDFKEDRAVLAVYIHRITGRAFDHDEKTKEFVTAYDIAMYEKMKGRLDEDQAAAVGEAVFKAPASVFFPDFQSCPKEPLSIPGLSERLGELKTSIEKRIQCICSHRQEKRGSSLASDCSSMLM
jgi:hypothetical protein